METQTEQLYDVLIVNVRSRVVDTIAGESMRMNKGHFTAEKRVETVSGRLNDDYFCMIVKTGLYQKGSVLPATELGE